MYSLLVHHSAAGGGLFGTNTGTGGGLGTGLFGQTPTCQATGGGLFGQGTTGGILGGGQTGGGLFQSPQCECKIEQDGAGSYMLVCRCV